MKKIFLAFLFSFVLIGITQGQNLTSSNLPIVIINTDNNVPIPNEPKVLATMKIIFRPDGSRNYLTDIDSAQFLNYDGRIGIETRGFSSQEFFEKNLTDLPRWKKTTSATIMSAS